MFYRKHLLWSSLLLLNISVTHFAAAQTIGIGGVTDKASYNDRATFFITNSAGFTYGATLDGASTPVGVSVQVNKADFHELSVWRTNSSTLATSNRLVRFIVVPADRSCCDAGLPPWVPYPFINSAAGEFAGAHLKVLTPQDYPAGLDIPVVAWVENDQGHAVRANGVLAASNQPSILIRRGAGSGLLPGAAAGGPLAYSPVLQGLATNKTINIEPSTTWTSVSGTLSGSTTWPENSRISIGANVSIPAGSSLTIGAGTVIRLGYKVNINLAGQIAVNGTFDRPVVWAPFNANQPWGGIMVSNASQVVASNAIWTGSGGEACFYSGGSGACGTSVDGGSHRAEQSLFHFAGAGSVTLNDCAAISLAGQFGHYNNGGNLRLDHVLIQRVTSGGQYGGGSIVMNDCALIEIPSDTDTFADRDNDGLYLENGGYSLTNCLVGWTKDDGIDSGGGGGGINNFVNCWFESTFHEGISGSGDNKFNNIKSSVFINCGQAWEAGYSAVTQAGDGCLSIGNVTGARFGDNYTSGYTYTGLLSVSNSFLLYNYRNVWGVTLNTGGSGVDTNQWVQRTNQMVVVNNYLSAPATNHPNNTIWDPATDGPLLGQFLNVPVNSPVGIGIALRNPQISSFSNAIPVRLSRFAVSPVSVQFTAETPTATLASGTLQFLPGETVKMIGLSNVNPQGHELVRISLKAPTGGELTSLSQAYLVNIPVTNPTPVTLVQTGSVWRYLDTGVDHGTAWRSNSFSDASWLSGKAQLGFGDGDEATAIVSNRQSTIYFRQSFNVQDPSGFTALSMWLLRDDAGVVFLNGQEVFRSPNLPQPPAAVTYTTLANATGENDVDVATINPSALVTGQNLAAVEIHQQSLTSSDVSFNFGLVGIPLPPAPQLKLARFSDGIILYSSDSAAALEEATQITGPWNSISTTFTPYSLTPGSSQRFYRLRR